MLAFLQQTILYLLPVITIPILIHLFTRQKSKKVLFSSLAFLKEMQNQNLRRVKLKQLLLILIRTFIVLFLVLAFARPTLKSFGFLTNGPTAATSTVVVILDNSMSMATEMNGIALFDDAREKAYQLLNSFHQGDEFHLISPLTQGLFDTIGPFYGLENIQKAIQNMTVLDGGTNISRALKTAEQILNKSHNANREIFLISDMQYTGFQEPVDSLSLSPDVRLFWLPVFAKDITNAGISNISIKNQILEPNKPIQIEASITNYGTTPRPDQLVQLYLDGKRSQQAAVSLAPNSSQVVHFSFTPKTRGFLSGMLRLDDDALSRDNKRYFTYYLPPAISVLLVGTSAEEMTPIRLALKPSDNGPSPITPRQVLNSDLNAINLHDYDIILLNNLNRISSNLAHKIQQYVHKGGNFVFLPGSNTDIRNFNATLGKLLKLPNFSAPTGTRGNKDAYISFEKIDFTHPVFEPLFDNSKPVVDSPQFYFSFGARIQTNSQTLISLSNNQPFLTETSFGNGKVLLFSSSIESDWSNWAVKGIFAPLLNRSVNYLAALQNDKNKDNLVGTPLAFQGNRKQFGQEFSALLPDGRNVQIFPGIKTGSILATITHTKNTGIYQLNCNKKPVANWAVNSPAAESNLTPLTEKNHNLFFRNNSVIQLNTNQNLEKQISSSRYGRELWPVFLILALIFLIIEMLLIRPPLSPERNRNIL
ncbi:BatA domain-containing protein [bacterium]|nr:BatA domain-containing protein [bacterium]